MNEPDIIGHAVASLLVFLLCGIGVFVMFLPQIDRLVEKWKTKPRLIIPNHTTPRAKDHSR